MERRLEGCVAPIDRPRRSSWTSLPRFGYDLARSRAQKVGVWIPMRDRIVEILMKHAGPAARNGKADVSTPLFDGGLEYSSIALLEAVMEIEDACGVRLRDEDLSTEVLSSIGSFVAHIQSRMRAR